jgi:hypothetical protein
MEIFLKNNLPQPCSQLQTGFAMAEYMIVIFLVALAVFAPFDGNGDSAVIMLAKSVASFFGAMTHIISLP